MNWYVLQHKPAQGDRAFKHLENQLITSFYPKVSVEKIRDGKRVTKLEPLFPGYLFVHLDQLDPAWAKLRSTRGVSRVVSFGNKPATVPGEVIAKIKEGLSVVAKQGGIAPGQRVELDEGPFRGISAVFQSYDGDERAIVLISFMQKLQKLVVPVSSIVR